MQALQNLTEAQQLAKLQATIESWTPDAKARAMEAYQARISGDTRIWYCKGITLEDGTKVFGRYCDGEPHGDYDYPHARADQWPPVGTAWFVWLIISGRGSGKTRTGAEWTRAISSKVGQIAGIGRRGVDFRATMVEGPSGLIYCCERAGIGWDWQPSKKEFTFGNGAKVFGYSAEEPDSLRGPQHGAAWLDEPAHMPLIEEVWSNLTLGLRMPGLPGGARILCTSTPLPTKWLRELMVQDDTELVRVSTYANIKNLDPAFKKAVIKKLEGTRKGRQELEGEVLEDVEGALWNADLIRRADFTPQQMERKVVAIDPAGTNNRKSDETGIVGVGKIGDIGYVLDDRTGQYTPNGWATAAIQMYIDLEADAIVAEKNYGGDMVKTTILSVAKKMGVTVRVIVVTATRSKQLRAEPVVARYEQQEVWHSNTVEVLGKLETEMLTWVPGSGDSPNRVDALVWGLTEILKLSGTMVLSSPAATNVRRVSSTPQITRRPMMRIR